MSLVSSLLAVFFLSMQNLMEECSLSLSLSLCLSRKVLVTNSRFLLAAKLGIVWPQALLEEENKELRQARRTVRMSVVLCACPFQ